MSPLRVVVVDATLGEIIVGASVKVIDDATAAQSAAEETDQRGVAEVYTNFVNLHVYVDAGEKYTEGILPLNRLTYCTVPTDCEIKVAVSKKLDSDALDPGHGDEFG